jgi:hypothetical protein
MNMVYNLDNLMDRGGSLTYWLVVGQIACAGSEYVCLELLAL